MACLRLFTLPPFPPFPLRSVPRFLLRIALATSLLALGLYLRLPDFLAAILDPPSEDIFQTVSERCNRHAEEVSSNQPRIACVAGVAASCRSRRLGNNVAPCSALAPERSGATSPPFCALHHRVVELDTGPGVAEEQASAAHVTSAHEVRGEVQPGAEHVDQGIDILARRDAPEQHDIAVRPGRLREEMQVAHERAPIPAVIRVDVHARETAEPPQV